MDQLYTQSDFARLALGAFPDLAEDFSEFREYLTMQMSAFARRLQQAKGAADWDGYERGVQVIEELWRRPDNDLHRSLSLTLMKGLSFEGTRGKLAWERLSPELQRAWQATRRHLDELTALPKKQRGGRR